MIAKKQIKTKKIQKKVIAKKKEGERVPRTTHCVTKLTTKHTHWQSKVANLFFTRVAVEIADSVNSSKSGSELS